MNCKKCNVELTEENRTKYNKENSINICKQCVSLQGKEYRKTHKKEIYLRQKIYNNKRVLPSKNGKICCGLNKRAKSVSCELCSNGGRLVYHHWDDNYMDIGMWLCLPCHFVAELIDRKGIDIIEKYIYLKKDIESFEDPRHILDDLHKYSIHLKKQKDKKHSMRIYADKYFNTYIQSISIHTTLDKNIVLRETINYNTKTGNVSYISRFLAQNGKKLINKTI